MFKAWGNCVPGFLAPGSSGPFQDARAWSCSCFLEGARGAQKGKDPILAASKWYKLYDMVCSTGYRVFMAHGI